MNSVLTSVPTPTAIRPDLRTATTDRVLRGFGPEQGQSGRAEQALVAKTTLRRLPQALRPDGQPAAPGCVPQLAVVGRDGNRLAQHFLPG